MNPYNVGSMYKNETEDTILQQYRDIEDVNAPYDRGKTYMHIAAHYADPEAMKILLEKGARANVTDESMQNTPLHELGHAEERRYGEDVSGKYAKMHRNPPECKGKLSQKERG